MSIPYFMIHNYYTDSSESYSSAQSIYISTNEVHARYTFNKLIETGANMELRFLRLQKVETDLEGMVHYEACIAAGWVKNVRIPSSRRAIDEYTRTSR